MVSSITQQMQAAQDLPNLNYGLNVKQLHCLLAPVIVSNILDHFLRKPANQNTVVGTLLGSLDGQIVDVQTSFSVPIEIQSTASNTTSGKASTKNEIIIDQEYLQKMLKFHRRVNPKEGLLGFYITGNALQKEMLPMFQFYQDLTKDKKNKSPFVASPLMLLIDPTMQDNKLSIKVLTLVTSNFVPVFSECAFSFAMADFEKSGLDVLFYGQTHYDTMAILQQREDVDPEQFEKESSEQKLLSNKNLLLKNFNEVIENLGDCESYIQRVIEKAESGQKPTDDDREMGRLLEQCMSEFSSGDVQQLEELISSNFEDALMVASLSRLQQKQLLISQKLNQTFSAQVIKNNTNSVSFKADTKQQQPTQAKSSAATEKK